MVSISFLISDAVMLDSRPMIVQGFFLNFDVSWEKSSNMLSYVGLIDI